MNPLDPLPLVRRNEVEDSCWVGLLIAPFRDERHTEPQLVHVIRIVRQSKQTNLLLEQLCAFCFLDQWTLLGASVQVSEQFAAQFFNRTHLLLLSRCGCRSTRDSMLPGFSLNRFRVSRVTAQADDDSYQNELDHVSLLYA